MCWKYRTKDPARVLELLKGIKRVKVKSPKAASLAAATDSPLAQDLREAGQGLVRLKQGEQVSRPARELPAELERGLQYKVENIRPFDRQLRRLAKKLPSLVREHGTLLDALEANSKPVRPSATAATKSAWPLPAKAQASGAAPASSPTCRW